VTEASASLTEKPPNSNGTLKQNQPALYGTLLTVNEQLNRIGDASIWLAIISAVVLCVATYQLHGRHCGDIVIGWGIVIAGWLTICITLLGIWNSLVSARRKRMFRSWQPRVEVHLRQANIDTMALIAQISDDTSLQLVATELKNAQANATAHPGKGDYR
jgi:hypothetical protein